MESLIVDLLREEVIRRMYGECGPRIRKCISELSTEQIWFRPNEESNSIGNLVLHLSGNVRQWICSGLGKQADYRKRQSEFDERDKIQTEELLRIFNSALADALAVIENVNEDQLTMVHDVQTFKENGISILIHVTEHFSYHTGQIAYITKMLTGEQLGFYQGVALE